MSAAVGSTGGMYGRSTRGAPLRQRALVRWTVPEPAVPAVLDVPDDVKCDGSVGLSAGAVMKGGNCVLRRPASGTGGG